MKFIMEHVTGEKWVKSESVQMICFVYSSESHIDLKDATQNMLHLTTKKWDAQYHPFFYYIIITQCNWSIDLTYRFLPCFIFK